MRGHVAGDRVGEAAADEKGLGAVVGELRREVDDLLVRDVPERLADVLDDRRHDRRVVAGRGEGRVLAAVERRLQLRGEFVLQGRLEFGIVLEAEPADEAQDGRRADAGLLREIGDGLQADQRIVGDQRLRGAALAGRHHADPVGDQFGNAGPHAPASCSRDLPPAVFPRFVAGSPSNKEILFDKALQAV